MGLGFRGNGLGVSVYGSRFGAWGLGVRIQRSELRVQILELRVQG